MTLPWSFLIILFIIIFIIKRMIKKGVCNIVVGYIYYITNKINGKKYIGKTINLKHRLECHFSDLKNHKHHSVKLQRAFDKYGENNFVISYQEVTVKDEQELSLLEIVEINKYDSKNNGYNITYGGEGHNTVIDFNTQVLIYQILQEYDGVNRQIANYFHCDHTVINKIKTNDIYKNIEYNEQCKEKLIIQIGLKDENKKENYIQHNCKKLNKESCLEILSIITQKTGYDNILGEIFNVDTKLLWRLKNNLIYKDYINIFNQMTEQEKQVLCQETFIKYDLETKRAERQRRGVKNPLTQQDIDYILSHTQETNVAIAKALNISTDRVRAVRKHISYKDLIKNYYQRFPSI